MNAKRNFLTCFHEPGLYIDLRKGFESLLDRWKKVRNPNSVDYDGKLLLRVALRPHTVAPDCPQGPAREFATLYAQAPDFTVEVLAFLRARLQPKSHRDLLKRFIRLNPQIRRCDRNETVTVNQATHTDVQSAFQTASGIHLSLEVVKHTWNDMFEAERHLGEAPPLLSDGKLWSAREYTCNSWDMASPDWRRVQRRLMGQIRMNLSLSEGCLPPCENGRSGAWKKRSASTPRRKRTF